MSDTSTPLFGPSVERLRDVVDGEPVPVPNAADACWARDSSGRVWVRKRESLLGSNGLLAEAVGYLLGRRLGVRQPNAAVLEDSDGWSWLSERVPAATHWSEEDRDYIDNFAEVGAMIALDSITLNEDRHAGNILIEPVSDEGHLRVWAIDSGNAVIGWPKDFMKRGLAPPDPVKHARGLPVPVLRDHAVLAAGIAASLHDHEIRGIAHEGCGLAREPFRAELCEALFARCRAAPEIVNEYLDRLSTQ